MSNTIHVLVVGPAFNDEMFAYDSYDYDIMRALYDFKDAHKHVVLHQVYRDEFANHVERVAARLGYTLNTVYDSNYNIYGAHAYDMSVFKLMARHPNMQLVKI